MPKVCDSRTTIDLQSGANWRRVAQSRWTFLVLHLVCLVYLFIGEIDIAGSLAVWFVMQIGIHAGYHRYFSHRSFQTHPWFEWVLGCAGSLAFQNGPLWWASKHRRHHQCADTGDDLHSPKEGFWHSHIGWLWSKEATEIDWRFIPDLLRPVPVWIERNQVWMRGIYLSVICLGSGWTGLVTWWILPVVACWHTTFATNSFCHKLGRQTYPCHPYGSCMARNNFLVAIANLGEGWHSNHHANPSYGHHGFYRWYQLDVVYLVLLALERMGIIWELKRRHVRLVTSSSIT
jgi:stearoyl-CoA desaturase (delta-9 desaturase)